MKIAIIGAGNVGSALATAWARGDHELFLGVRDVNKPAVRALSEATGAAAMIPADAAAAADVVVLSLPWLGAEASIRALGNLSGKVVIDCTNPLGFEDGRLFLERGFTTSGGEAVAGWLPGAQVVKTLNQVGAELMADNATLNGDPVMFVAGDHPDAKDTVMTLLKEIGFEAIDAGDITQSRLLEPFAMVWINQTIHQGFGRDWAFGVLRKND